MRTLAATLFAVALVSPSAFAAVETEMPGVTAELLELRQQGGVLRLAIRLTNGSSKADVCPPCELPFPEVCCDRWHEAERTKVPCDASRDADCDGTPNDLDDEPFAPSG